jgi:hypothetical protein
MCFKATGAFWAILGGVGALLLTVSPFVSSGLSPNLSAGQDAAPAVRQDELLPGDPAAFYVPEAAADPGVKPARIGYEAMNPGGADGAVTLRFFVEDHPPAKNLVFFKWDFGDGRQTFEAEPVREYTGPETYAARLTARDQDGGVYRSAPLYIDIPHPEAALENSGVKFVTLSAPDDPFTVNGIVTRTARYANVDAAPLRLTGTDGGLTEARFGSPGFYGLTVENGQKEQYYSVFVSPLPTVHVDAAEKDFNWYRTQFNTGTTGNCGPATVSMAVAWSTGKYFPVSAVRQAVGWRGEGETSFEELLAVMKEQGVPAAISPIRGAGSVREVIDAGGIAVVLFRTDGVRTAKGDPARNLFGKYYNDSVGHYVVIKGYSLDGEYFVIYDPIPSDWSVNSFRYGDDLSMIGRNRYYSTAELLGSLRRQDMIVAPLAAR